MVLARVHDDLIVLETPHRETHLAKLVPGARHHARRDDHHSTWHFVAPLSWASCVTLRGVFGNELQVAADLYEWAAEEKLTRVDPALALAHETDFSKRILGWDERLRDYQTQASEFLTIAKQAILADDMRVGKTPESAAALNRTAAFPALVVVPNSVKFQWEEELAKWVPDARSVIISGGVKQRREAIGSLYEGSAEIGIVNWELIRRHSRLMGYGSVVALARCERHGGDGTIDEKRCEAHPRELNEIAFKTLIADEAHRAAHPRAKQTRALWALMWPAEYRWLLTGTPVLSSPADLWALGHAMAPEEYPAKSPWIDRYGLVGWNPFGGLEVLGLREDLKPELFSYVDPRFMRRTREQVMPWLPEAVREERRVQLGAKQRKAYDEMKRELLTELDDGGVTYVTNALTKLTRLRQFAAAYGRVEVDEETGKRTLKLTNPSSKIEDLIEVAPELAGESTIVFAESKQLIKLAGAALEKAKYSVGYVTGDEDVEARAAYVSDFQRGDVQFICVTLGAGGEGLTLDRASVEIFLQRSFSLHKNSQAEDRGAGKGTLLIVDIVTDDTVEARVLEVLGDKERITEEIVRDNYRRLM